jgi:hypothetical protein
VNFLLCTVYFLVSNKHRYPCNFQFKLIASYKKSLSTSNFCYFTQSNSSKKTNFQIIFSHKMWTQISVLLLVCFSSALARNCYQCVGEEECLKPRNVTCDHEDFGCAKMIYDHEPFIEKVCFLRFLEYLQGSRKTSHFSNKRMNNSGEQANFLLK